MKKKARFSIAENKKCLQRYKAGDSVEEVQAILKDRSLVAIEAKFLTYKLEKAPRKKKKEKETFLTEVVEQEEQTEMNVETIDLKFAVKQRINLMIDTAEALIEINKKLVTVTNDDKRKDQEIRHLRAKIAFYEGIIPKVNDVQLYGAGVNGHNDKVTLQN